ncbi:MAG: DUF998 domain-containing protein, partial [Anaerolineales bacterium]
LLGDASKTRSFGGKLNQRFLSMCGGIAPLLFVFIAILGGAIRPGYSHLSDTVSELFSPGSPNKLLLDILNAVYALLLVLFGIGVLQLVQRSKLFGQIGVVGASMFMAMGLLSVLTATIFPQDAWGSLPTFPGKMHIILGGVITLLSIPSMALIGIWLNRTGLFPRFRTYSFITVGAVVLSTGFFLAKAGSPIMGLTERIVVLIQFQWIFVLALWMFSRKGNAGG